MTGWKPRAPRFFQPHGSFTGGTEAGCLFHPRVDDDLHAFTGHAGLHGIFCLLRIHTGLAEILEALREYLGTADALHHDFRAAALYDNRITEVDALQIKDAELTRLFRRVRYAHDLGKAGHIIGQTVRDLVKTCARLNIHILREAAVKLLALGGGAVMTIVELRLGIQNLQVLTPVAKPGGISYNMGIKTYIQNSRCQNRENGGIGMIFGYARVSTKTQARDGNSLEAQREALITAGAEKIYTDTFTGTKMDRPEWDRLRAQLRRGDVLIVTRLDRLARSVSQASGLITEMIDEGITINVLNLGILSNDSVNTLLRNVLLSFAQFERDMIVQRTQEGKAVARATDPDFREGRPPKFDTEQLDHAMELLENHSYTQVVKLTGISKSTLIREKKRRQT